MHPTDEPLDPRAQRSRAAALAAARDLLVTEGRDAVTPSRVARVAGVGRATIYRHWPQPLALLVEAATLVTAPDPPEPTGDLARDLIARLDGLRRGLESSALAAVFAMLIEQAERAPELQRVQRDVTEAGSAPLRALLRDAVDRGALPALDEERAVEVLAAPLFYRRFIARRPIPPDLPRLLVADFLAHPPAR